MFTDSVRAVRRVTNRRGSRDRSIIVHVESRMAEEIRRRRRMENSLLDEEESDGPTTTDDVLADEPVLGLAHTGPQFPLLFRPRTRTLSSTRSSISEFGDHYEHESLLHPEKLAVDPSLNWLQRTQKSLRGDFSSICLLLFLYLLQGIPLGLIAAIPLVLSSKNASYGQQAVFSFAYWPFSLKLLWAPIVDSVYWKRMGRRKSWMVPCQYLIGTFMLVLSYKVADIMGDNDTQSSGKAPNVVFLMLVFLPLNFLAATQDIAVDGWALTMLSRKNVGYASTCNAVGQTAGFFLGNVVYLTLDSPDFANRFFRSEPQPYGLVSLSGFVFFWGWVFLITTTLVLIFKKEVDHSITPSSPDEGEELELGIVDTYAVLWKIIRLKPMLWLLIVLLTGKIAFAATDGITGLKLIGMGMPKDKLSSMAVFLTPLQVLLPWMIGK
uniref:Acetyl-coenzyme A transporter 1 n=2 Tax=Parascaris univalens TaxID=6257 RepID=A0A915CBA8_PARUN